MKLSTYPTARCPWRSRRKLSLRGLNKLSCFTRLPQDTNCRQCDSFCDIFSIMNVWWKIITWRKYLFAFGCRVNESGVSESENSCGKQIYFPALVFDTQTKVFFLCSSQVWAPTESKKSICWSHKKPIPDFFSISLSLSFSFSWFQDGFEYLRNKRKHRNRKATWRSVSEKILLDKWAAAARNIYIDRWMRSFPASREAGNLIKGKKFPPRAEHWIPPSTPSRMFHDKSRAEINMKGLFIHEWEDRHL